MKLADKISLKLQLFAKHNNNDIVIPNFYVGMYEMDLFRITSTDFLYEYEVKISRSDFKNDFTKGSKHSKMINGTSPCNRFYFVTPKGLIHKNEVPDYAGLIEFDVCENGTVDGMMLIKNAKLIHKNKVRPEFYKTVACKLAFRERHLKYKIRVLNHKNKTNN